MPECWRVHCFYYFIVIARCLIRRPLVNNLHVFFLHSILDVFSQ